MPSLLPTRSEPASCASDRTWSCSATRTRLFPRASGGRGSSTRATPANHASDCSGAWRSCTARIMESGRSICPCSSDPPSFTQVALAGALVREGVEEEYPVGARLPELHRGMRPDRKSPSVQAGGFVERIHHRTEGGDDENFRALARLELGQRLPHPRQ